MRIDGNLPRKASFRQSLSLELRAGRGVLQHSASAQVKDEELGPKKEGTSLWTGFGYHKSDASHQSILEKM